jgi:hypothetical protein
LVPKCCSRKGVEVKGRSTSLELKGLALAVALAVLAAPTVQARAATSVPRSVTTALRAEERATIGKADRRQVAREQLRLTSSASYFWADAGIAAGVLAGFVVLGLWGDVAIGGLIVGVALLGARAALIARKACLLGREAFVREAPPHTPTPEAPTPRPQTYAELPRGTGR